SSLTDRQERLSWWNQRTIAKARILIAGAGGIGGRLALIFSHMGIGWQDIVDPDVVETTNLNRQNFTIDDVGHPKAHATLRRIAPFATRRCALRGFWMTFERL